MSLTRTQVEGIAHLARLEITEAQMPVYVESLSRIIDFVEQLAAADTAGVEPMAHPLADQVQRASPPDSTWYPRSSSDAATVMVPFPGKMGTLTYFAHLLRDRPHEIGETGERNR